MSGAYATAHAASSCASSFSAETRNERNAPLAPPAAIFAAAAPAYLEHGSIAYGADWGFRAGPRGVPDVVVSCSFYDRGVRAWSRA